MFSPREYHRYFKNRRFALATSRSVIFLLISLAATFYSLNYINLKASNSVTDIVLSNTKAYDVDGFFVFGAIFMVLIITLIILSRPKYIPFAVQNIALFYLIRAAFTSLTHIGPFPTRISLDYNFLSNSRILGSFFTGDDLFFSGHVGLPFLIALIFWEYKHVRYFFLGLSGFFGMVVLLGHIHYSIDVLSAYFITYTIFHIGRFIFRKDHKIFIEGL
jgi:hypothetical protein